MNWDFGGRTQLAGSGKTGIRWPLAEWLGSQGGLVFCVGSDCQELADELQHLHTAAQVIELNTLWGQPAANPSAPIEQSVPVEQEDDAHGGKKWAQRAESAEATNAGRHVLLFEDWWQRANCSRPQTVFMTQEPDMVAPVDLIEEAVAALSYMYIYGIRAGRSPAEPAPTGLTLNLRAMDPRHQMSKRQDERFLARDPLQLTSSSLAQLVALLIMPMR